MSYKTVTIILNSFDYSYLFIFWVADPKKTQTTRCCGYFHWGSQIGEHWWQKENKMYFFFHIGHNHGMLWHCSKDHVSLLTTTSCPCSFYI